LVGIVKRFTFVVSKANNIKTIQFKKVYGENAVIVNDMTMDLVPIYQQAKKEGKSFYVNNNGRLQAWGIFSVANYMGIKDVSTIL
jgi:hypothetical protein